MPPLKKGKAILVGTLVPAGKGAGTVGRQVGREPPKDPRVEAAPAPGPAEVPDAPEPVVTPVPVTPELVDAPEPPPVPVAGRRDALTDAASDLTRDIEALESRIDAGDDILVRRAPPSEDISAQVTREELTSQLRDKRRQLVQAQKDFEGLGEPEAPAAEVEVEAEEFDEQRGPVYPERTGRRFEEKVREYETGEKTMERQYPGVWEYLTPLTGVGGLSSETLESYPTAEAKAEGKAPEKEVFTSTRRREDLADAVKSVSGLGQLGGVLDSESLAGQAASFVADLPDWIDAGYVKGLESYYAEHGELPMGESRRAREMGYSSDKDALDAWRTIVRQKTSYQRGGEMFAPRGQVDEDKLGAEKATRRCALQRMGDLIPRLRREIESMEEAPLARAVGRHAYAKKQATLQSLLDEKEQIEAELSQLMRVTRVTLPRSRAEAETRPAEVEADLSSLPIGG